MNCGNADNRFVSGQELGEWLRRQRQARAWSRPEMARQLIKAARASGDTSMPCIDSVCHNIYRWERGTVGLTERYMLYYCAALGIDPGDFGAGQEEKPAYPFIFSAGELAVLDLLAGAVRLWRDFRREIAIIRNGEGEQSLAGIEAGAHDHSA